jgi:hypothetical protein
MAETISPTPKPKPKNQKPIQTEISTAFAALICDIPPRSRKMKIIATTVAFLVAGYGFLLLWGEWIVSQDASFEASDGVWADGTVKFKGRGFREVLWMFEAYKLVEEAEKVELFRTTKKPDWWSLFWPKKEKENPMWAVPYRPGTDQKWYIVRRLTEEEISTIDLRAEVAFDLWKERATKREQVDTDNPVNPPGNPKNQPDD